jgi:hypothetical protein
VHRSLSGPRYGRPNLTKVFGPEAGLVAVLALAVVVLAVLAARR